MQLSYNVIKNSEVISQGNKEIVTDLEILKKSSLNKSSSVNNDSSNENIVYNLVDDIISAAKEEAENIAREANLNYDRLIAAANENVQDIEKRAYEDGYEAGLTTGYNEGYEKSLTEATKEAETIINTAKSVLFNAKLEYQEYLKEKKDDILMLAINMAEVVIKRELSSTEGLNGLLQEALSISKNSETFIIKTSNVYVEELKAKVELWRNTLGLKGEIFILADETVGECNAVIEKNNGKIEIGLKAGMDGIRHALL
jgi:flagellar assembly protein FliH